MRKRISSFLTLILLVALVAVIFVPCTMTASAVASPVTITIPNVEVTRTSNGSYMPSETYTFTLTPGTIDASIDVSQDGTPVFAGPAATMVTDQVTVSGSSATVNIVATTNMETPGIYKYQLQQVAGTMAGETYATDVYNVYVHYGYAAPSATAPSIIAVMCYDASDNYTLGGAEHKVTPSFENTFQDSHLKITKRVTGNMGDLTKNFDFWIMVRKGTSGVNAGDVIPVTVKKNGVLVTDFTSIVVSADNESRTVNFQLKDGDTLDIQGLPFGLWYCVSETSSTSSDGYGTTVQYVAGNAGPDNPSNSNPGKSSGTIVSDNELVYTNNKEDVITGLFDNYMPYLALIICASLLAAIFAFSKRKEKTSA